MARGGPGKTTLAYEVAAGTDALYLDLEAREDRAGRITFVEMGPFSVREAAHDTETLNAL